MIKDVEKEKSRRKLSIILPLSLRRAFVLKVKSSSLKCSQHVNKWEFLNVSTVSSLIAQMKKLLYIRSVLTHILTLHTQKDPFSSKSSFKFSHLWYFVTLFIVNIISEYSGNTLINTILHVRVWIVTSNPVECVKVRACVRVPGGELCPAAAVAIAKAEAGETGQREFSPDWTDRTWGRGKGMKM